MKVTYSLRVATFLTLTIVTFPSQADNFWKESYEPAQPFAKIDAAIDRFQEHEKLAKSNSKEKINLYLRSGILVSDIACDNWLAMLGRSERDANVAKSIINIVGNLILGISGINGANPRSLAKGALGLGAMNASVDTFKNEVLLGTIADIEAKLQEGRHITASTIRTNVPGNFDDAQGMLLSYHNECSPNAIKVLLRKSLAAVKYEPADTTLSDARLDAKARLATADLAKEMYGLGVSTIPDDLLYRLYVTQIAAPSDTYDFIEAMKTGDFTEAAKTFNQTNLEKRKILLETIAGAKGYPQRFIADRDAALAEAAARKKRESSRAEEAGKAAGAVSESGVKGISSTELAAAKAVIAAPISSVISDDQLNAATKVANKAANIDSKNTVEFSKRLGELIEARKSVSTASDTVESIKSIPSPVLSPSIEKSLTSDTPVSVNAVLVPKGDVR